MSFTRHIKIPFLQKYIDIGANREFSFTEIRYLRVSNIAGFLGAIYNAIWMVVVLYISEESIIYISNLLMGLLFLMVLVFNHKGWRVLSAVWLTTLSLVSVFFFLYLLGYSSGVVVICFLIIVMPYMIFPRKARIMAHVFSFVAFLGLVFCTVFQTHVVAHYGDIDPYLSQSINTSLTGFICLTLIGSLSVLIDKTEESLVLEQKKSDNLLHNILPANIVKDLKESGKTIPKRHNHVTILFTDFQGFTELVASMSPIQLVNELNDIFGRFDEIMEETKVEKIETIGDAYMAACGLQEEVTNHAHNCIVAAQNMLKYLEQRNRTNDIKWHMRVGIHSGTIVAGVVGKKKFAYDLFGDTINTASRIESAGEAGKINISETTYQLVKNDFHCKPRGKIFAKGKGELDMYFVND